MSEDRVELIVTEKDNAARRIADILSGDTASVSGETVTVYRWTDDRGVSRVCVGLSGHVVGVDFPPEYEDWRAVEPVELVDADIRTTTTRADIVRELRSLARAADRVTIATDYDREGELIGKEAHEIVREETDAPVDRVRFSSITDREVREAFGEPDEIDFDLAAAGEARQVVDLVWGAALTRFLSLSAGRLGDEFISVGRVQSPTLRLIVEREREIRAFDPEDYWELFADLADGGDVEAQYFYEDDGEQERVWDETDAETARDTVAAADAATVTEVRRRTRTDRPPAPFDTTAFISAAGSLGYGAEHAMSVAEDLYTAGYVTYPRTDNTVYPDDLDPDELLAALSDLPETGEDAASLRTSERDGEIDPTRGDTASTDHPPIHPTDETPDLDDLDDDETEIYELVVRRFLATVAESAEWAHVRVVAAADGARLKANGRRLLSPGYHRVYPYVSSSEEHLPDVSEGDDLAIADVRLAAKRTQPPRRYSQSRLVEIMKERGIGTKCLTADTEILVRDRDGDVSRRPAGDVFDQGRVALADGDTDVAVTEDGPTVLSLDESNQRHEEREASLVSERPVENDEEILTIRTERSSISVTEDHPMYVERPDGFDVVPAEEVTPGEHLLAVRRSPSAVVDRAAPEPGSETSPVLTWETFAASSEWSTMLFGVDCGEALREYRRENGESQSALADRIGTYHPKISRCERGLSDVPVWILGEIGVRPDRLHGQNYDTTFRNPFPLHWSPELARVVANLLCDGSVHHDEAENVVDVRYHNTDRRLIDRFADDVRSLFDIDPTISERGGREEHHRTRYQVSLSAGVSRVLARVLDAVHDDGRPRIPDYLVPVFVGALFDDEGHISTDRKAFVSNTDHQLLVAVREMLAGLNIDATVSENQHKLYVRGRRDLERFLGSVPIADDRKFYCGLDALRQCQVTETKARIMERAAGDGPSSHELAAELGLSVAQVRKALRELREEGHVERRARGSNRGSGDARVYRYTTDSFESSIYATLRGVLLSTTVETVEQHDYEGPVYDLTVDPAAPNFAVGGGTIVHNSTRHHTLEKLYDRGYVDGDPPRPTRLATAVVDAVEEYAEQIVSEEMTRRLEADMTAIAEGEATLDEVTDESREMLRAVFDDLSENHEAVGELLRESLKEDAALGDCPECGERLLVRRSRSGSAFVGCDGYPSCEFTLPLPDRGEPEITDDVCDEHGLHAVRMLDGRNTYTHGCPVCAAEAAGDGPLVGTCPDCGREHDGRLRVKRLQSGSRLVGCSRYPDCEYSLPLPRRGALTVTEDRCGEHGLREVVVDADSDDPWELGCPVCNFREYRARQAEQGGALDLRSVEGVDERVASVLADADVTSVADLVAADPADLADRTDIEEHRARGLRRAAIAAVEGLDDADDDDDTDGGDGRDVAVDPETGDAESGAEA
jgi:DNA topoisomerase-1